MPGQEDRAEDFLRTHQMMKIGAAVAGARRAAALRVQGPRVFGVTSVANIDGAKARERLPGAPRSRRQDAIEQIDTAFHGGHDVGGPADPHKIARAIERGETPRGASTLTQQLAKNLWLSPTRNPLRKLSEAALTIHLEEYVPKRRLLEIYLNVVEFGIGIYGAEAAARHYFNKPASQLSEREAALLAASLPRPKSWHPGVDDDRYLSRARRIQTWMIQAHFLNRYL